MDLINSLFVEPQNQRIVATPSDFCLHDFGLDNPDLPVEAVRLSRVINKLTDAFQNLVSFLEKGGLKNVLLGIGDILGYIGSILKPIKEGFREIFPKKTVDELVTYTEKFKEWTSTLKLSEQTAQKLKNTFKGKAKTFSNAFNNYFLDINGYYDNKDRINKIFSLL